MCDCNLSLHCFTNSCNICYETIDQTNLYLCPNETIKHEYHQNCIDNWKSMNQIKSSCCPVCNISLISETSNVFQFRRPEIPRQSYIITRSYLLTKFPDLIDKKELNLDMENISFIALDSFQGLTNLEVLYLDHNIINSDNITYELFDGLINLRELYLHNNNMHYLNIRIFDVLHKLEKITLFGNDGIERYVPIEHKYKIIDEAMYNELSDIESSDDED